MLLVPHVITEMLINERDVDYPGDEIFLEFSCPGDIKPSVS